MKKYFLLPAFLWLSVSMVAAQQKKPIEHADVHRWKKIEQQKISNDGQWIAWAQTPVTEGDSELQLWNARTGSTIAFPRGSQAQFSEDSKWLIFRIKPALDSLKNLRRKKVKEDDLPKDTLGIFNLEKGSLEKIPRLKNFSLPEKWNGWLAYQLDSEKIEKPGALAKDSSSTAPPDSSKITKPSPKPPAGKSAKKPKKEDKDNGYRLIVRNLTAGLQDTIAYVKEFALAKSGPRILLHTTGKGDTLTFPANPKVTQNGVYLLDLGTYSMRPLMRGKGKFQQLALDDFGNQACFLADLDTSKARIRPWQLGYWENKLDSAKLIAGPQSHFLPNHHPSQHPQQSHPPQPSQPWTLSEHTRPIFSEDASKLYFGIAPPPILNDTTLLKEEIVDVEVWAWNDKRLYTQEESRLENEKKRAYQVVLHLSQNLFVKLNSPEMPELRLVEQRTANLALGISEEPYTHYITSEGTAHKDLFLVNLETGNKKMIVKDLRCNPRISPSARYVAWWSDPDTAWYAWNTSTEKLVRLTDNQKVAFYNEENDVPDYPNEFGLAGWLQNDESVLVYDRYDIWKLDPDGKKKPQRLTQGRESRTRFRYLKLDPEQYSILPNERILLHQFNDSTKAEGYAWLDLSKTKTTPWLEGDFYFSRAPLKAKNADVLLFTKENYQTFPDLQVVDFTSNKNQQPAARTQKISNANPQQSEYQWGSLEMVEWTSLTGEKLKGMLVKPEDFDPAKQYPMIVNFYEKMSDDLNRHRSPDFHRSQINFTVYTSRGYLIFAPDIPYQIGYPGESAFNSIMSGVTALISKGFVDPKRIALQGHSWGGYQAAYLVTRTNLFACAEAGAPVANMTSAYGGIRWESGLNRAFQYERQQSRIGGSLWEKPKQYLENSPLFSLDKVETPLLILHNDKDGAVPWYQGIELFSGLRRLGKPAWLLNYNDEPHWPVKLQNRLDFHRRMQQFFDHYLQNAPQPSWMKRGVPPMEKGILQGY
jgi:dipeptidyl aminopeptidase/acylaminoacyl peptidase